MPEPVPLTVLRCSACHGLDPGPRLLCPHCGAQSLQPHDVPGRGTLVSWTVIRRPPLRFRNEGPFAVAVIDLEAGLRVTGRLSRVPEHIRPSMEVIATGHVNETPVFEDLAP